MLSLCERPGPIQIELEILPYGIGNSDHRPHSGVATVTVLSPKGIGIRSPNLTMAPRLCDFFELPCNLFEGLRLRFLEFSGGLLIGRRRACHAFPERPEFQRVMLRASVSQHIFALRLELCPFELQKGA